VCYKAENASNKKGGRSEWPVADTALTLKETGYVTKDQKRLLFRKKLADYRKANPDAEAVSSIQK